MWFLKRKKTFDDLRFTELHHVPFGIKAEMFFDNGFGCSVVKNQMSYGGAHGYYEIAVLKGNQDKNEFYYSDEIFENAGVEGWLDEKGISKAMKKIQKLKIKE